MLKLRLRMNGKPVIGFGLSRKNCEKLLAGQPIFFPGEQVGLDGVHILIMAGDTEHKMLHEIIDNDITIVKEGPRT